MLTDSFTVRQLNSVANDGMVSPYLVHVTCIYIHPDYSIGVPGVTQCPIAPGQIVTYKFKATQYGTSWYHSHLSLQAALGMAGPIVIHGPATANYDVDVGPVMLKDWFHSNVWEIWRETQRVLALIQPVAENGLIGGLNPYQCDTSDPACVGGAERFEVRFEQGKRYRFRIIAALTDGWQKFTIDGHKLQVIAVDFVPIVPYVTDNIILTSGQRYDVIVEADQPSGQSYWLRAPYQTACNNNGNDNADNILGIVRYTDADTTLEPTTTISRNVDNSCGDEPYASLTPWVSRDVGDSTDEEWLRMGWYYQLDAVFKWTLHGDTLVIDFDNPSMLALADGQTDFSDVENVYVSTAPSGTWLYLIVQDLTEVNAFHPLHLHGHDFYILAQGSGLFVPGLVRLNTKNPPRRDTATNYGNGYLVLGVKMDNPGYGWRP